MGVNGDRPHKFLALAAESSGRLDDAIDQASIPLGVSGTLIGNQFTVASLDQRTNLITLRGRLNNPRGLQHESSIDRRDAAPTECLLVELDCRSVQFYGAFDRMLA